MWLALLIVIGLALFLAGSSLFALLATRVPVVRTPLEVLPAIAELGQLKPGRLVVDAGCADGRALLHLCRSQGWIGRGYELNGPVFLVGWLRTRFSAGGNLIRLYWKDFYRSDWEDVDLVFCFLMPGSMATVGRKCIAEMRPGSRLISYLWPVPDWMPAEVRRIGKRQDPLYLYVIKQEKNDGGSGPAGQKLDGSRPQTVS